MPFKYFGAILALGMAWLSSTKRSQAGPLVGIGIVLAAVTANTSQETEKAPVP